MKIMAFVVIMSCLVCVECAGNTNAVTVTYITPKVTVTNSPTKTAELPGLTVLDTQYTIDRNITSNIGKVSTNFWGNFDFKTTYDSEKSYGCDTVTYKVLEAKDRTVSLGPILQTVYPMGNQTIRDGIFFGFFCNKRF